MRKMYLRWTMSVSLAALCCAPLGCDRSSGSKSDEAPPEIRGDAQSPSSQPAPNQTAAPQTGVELGGTMKALQKRAADGDVPSMVTLAQAFEAMGVAHKAEARQWYEKAAAKGDSSAKEALHMMDATAAATSRPADQSPTTQAGAGTSSAVANSGAASRPAAAPGDLEKVRWVDVLGSFDSHDFSTVTQPDFRKHREDVPIFVGVSTAADKMLTVAASGADDNDINAVSVVLRIRSRDNLGANNRVSETATICAAVTHGNVSQNDMLDWLAYYLRTGKKSDPTFRNGWTINVSGTDAEGIADPKKFRGEAVLIEMKK